MPYCSLRAAEPGTQPDTVLDLALNSLMSRRAGFGARMRTSAAEHQV